MEDDSATGIPENPQWLAGVHRQRETVKQREAEEVCVCVWYKSQGEVKEKGSHGNVSFELSFLFLAVINVTFL